MAKTFVRALALSLFLLSGLKSSAQEVQTVAYGSSDRPTITIPSGKVIEIISGNFVFGISGSSQQIYGTPDPLPIYFAGPAALLAAEGSAGWITYRLKDNISSTTTIPTSAVVIPTDATGPVNVILESSTDLVTWTQANPGTYGSSTSKRFFRVRAVNQ